MSEPGTSELESAAQLRLEVVAGNARGTIIAVEDRIVFGRQSEGPGSLADDLELSRHHAEVSRAASGDYTIADLASTNGTFVNRVRIDQPTVLHGGDLIDIGTTRLIVRDAPAPPPAPRAVDVRAATVIVDASGPPPPADLEPEPPSVEPEPAPPLELRLAVDVERGEAEIELADGSDRVRLRLEDGRWRIGEAGP